MAQRNREDMLEEAGAVIDDGVVRHYGSPAGERQILATGAGLVDADRRDRVAVAGPDAASFLDRLLTVGVKTLEPGQGAPAYLLDARGRIQLSFDLYRLDALRFLTEATAGHGADIVQRLDMFHFGEDLAFEPEDGAVLISGSAADEQAAFAPTAIHDLILARLNR